MKTRSIHTPSISGRNRVLFATALLSGLALVSPVLHAQTYQGQDNLSPVPTELQIALMPTQPTDRVRIAIANPRNTLVRIKVLDQRGRTYYEGYERGEQLIVPFNFSSASPGLYTIDVCTKGSRKTQTFMLEPPKPKRILPVADDPGALTTNTRVGQ